MITYFLLSRTQNEFIHHKCATRFLNSLKNLSIFTEDSKTTKYSNVNFYYRDTECYIKSFILSQSYIFLTS